MSIFIEENIMPDIEYLVLRKCPPGWFVKDHLSIFCEFTYLIAGNAQYTIDGIPYDLAAGDLLCLSANTRKAAITYPDRLMQCFSVNFHLKDRNGEAVRLPIPTVTHMGCRKDIIRLFHEINFVWLDRQPGYIIKTRALLLLILHRFLELTVYNIDSDACDCRIKKVSRYVAKHYAEKLSVKKMAAMVDLNTDYFGTLFKQEIGLSFHQYLTKTRIRNAENMLRSGEYKVCEVAAHCGYTDIFHFHKQYKAVMGISPSQSIPKRQD